MAGDTVPTTTRPGLKPGHGVGRAINEPPPGVRTDLAVIAEPTCRLGYGESRRVPGGGTAESAGVTWERVDAEDGDFRPCPSVDRPGTPRLFGRLPVTPAGVTGVRPYPDLVARLGVVPGGGHREASALGVGGGQVHG